MNKKTFTIEYFIDFEGFHHKEVDADNPKLYTYFIEKLAKGEIELVEFPEPSAKILGKKAFALYKAELAKVQAAKAKRSEAAKRGIAARKIKEIV